MGQKPSRERALNIAPIRFGAATDIVDTESVYMSQPREPHEPFVRHGDQLETFLQNFWQRQVDAAENDPPPYGRHPPLPLARIKKVMKSDPDVRMIASDAPVLFCKACEIFIQEITCRAFLVADAHKRRTISKSDIAKALAKSDHFDFLIDVVPRDEAERAKTQKALVGAMENALAEQTKVEGVMAGTSGHGQISPTTQQQHSPLGPPLMYQHPSGHLTMTPHMHAQQGALTHQGRNPAPLNLSMPPHRTHSQSHSQSQPPPLIPNLRSPTGNGHQQQAPSNQRRQSVTGMSLSPTIPMSSSRMDPPSGLDISR